MRYVLGKFGVWERMGHYDFFPNGGKKQPGCKHTSRCSHNKASNFYTSSIYNNNKGDFFKSTKCGSYDNWKEGKCEGKCQLRMGEALSEDVEEYVFIIHSFN